MFYVYIAMKLLLSNWSVLRNMQGQRYTVHNKIAEKSWSRLLLLFVFILFHLRYYINNAWKTDS